MKNNIKAVLITGCGSGIGRACALYLSERGYLVFAGVRKEEDAAALRRAGHDSLVPVCPLELTKTADIKRAAEEIQRELSRRGIGGLYAVVNNAGGGFIAPIELMDLEKWRQETETRLVGPVALLQVFLPLIRQAQGRVLWIQTPGLAPIAFDTSIHACDFASNCLSRTLRQELLPWGIQSVQIRCGGIDTPSVGRSYEELAGNLARWRGEGRDFYRETLLKTEKSFRAMDTRRTEPEKVARLVFRALEATQPHRRYRVGYLSGVSSFMEVLPQPLVDWVMEKR